MFKYALVALLVLLLSACSTVTPDSNFAFDARDSYGLLAVKRSLLSDDNIYFLQPADLNTQRFYGDTITYANCYDCIGGQKIYKLDTSDDPKYSFLSVPAGTYAIVARKILDTRFVNKLEHILICHNPGTIVFDVKAGQITRLSLSRSSASDIQELIEVGSIISAYPGVTAEIVESKALASIVFETGSGRRSNYGCLRNIEGRSFFIVREHGQGQITENYLDSLIKPR